jgi:hypothetical protein
MVAMSDGTKVCRCCRVPKPIGEFRRRARGGEGRLNQCRTCHREAERCRRAVKRAKRDGKAIDGFAAAVKRARGVEDVLRLTDELYRRFGGPDGFVEAVYSHYLDAEPGGAGRARILLAMKRLVELKTAREEADAASFKEKVQYYTDEELEEDLNDHILNMIRKSPELVIAVAKDWGWTVNPLTTGG